MSDIIRHLPQDLINQIAAGEVVERPASVLKELIENSIDAESTQITIKVDKGGSKFISVADNGTGMSRRDACSAFERHATSKLVSSDDLFNIRTLGFRGEALASIAAVSRVSLKTRERAALTGTFIEITGGSILKNTECGCPQGTEIEVRDIFYNVPARKSFLKAVSTEHGHILSTVTHQALSNTNIHFILTGDGDRPRVIYDLPPVTDIAERILQIYGSDISEGLIPVSFKINSGNIDGLVSSPAMTFRTRENQLFFVNKRAVKNPSLSHAVQQAYRDLIPGDSFPIAVLFIDISPESVDVNVHPTKREVRFRDSRYVHDMVVEAIRGALHAGGRNENAGLTPAFMTGFKEASFKQGINLRSAGWLDRGQFSNESLTVSEGFNPFLENAEYKPQEMYAEPIVRVFGQTAALFIVAEINGQFSIIDQHAAHERIVYDRLMRGYDEGGLASQPLLLPETIELSLDKAHTLCEYMEFLNKLGFDIGEIGDRSFIVRAVPDVFTGDDFKSLLIDMTDEIIEKDFPASEGMKIDAMDKVVRSLLSRKACHAAVRAKGLLTTGEMMALVKDLLHTDMPYTCPHGRPVIRRFTYDELAGMFGRK
ncbi:MAG: DNA mismatch repair endonuclease MutL [Nitrospirae bacterium]|nr:DNA mismatch repair endonuclease MutL [Nitrospirota bacterium]